MYSPQTVGYAQRVGIVVRAAADGIGIIGTGEGVVTGQDLLAATAQLIAEGQRNSELRYAVMDLSAIPEQELDTRSLKAAAVRPRSPMPELIVAVVAPSEILFGLSRMWEMLAEQSGLATRVVRTREEAITFLQEQLTQPVHPFEPID